MSRIQGAAMNRFRNTMQHYFNPLHVYCRLRTMGFSGSLAKRVSSFYEQRVYAKVSCSLFFLLACTNPRAKQKTF